MSKYYSTVDRGYARAFRSLKKAQEALDECLSDYHRQGYVVTELPLEKKQVVMWNLNLNGSDVGTVGIVEGNLEPKESQEYYY